MTNFNQLAELGQKSINYFYYTENQKQFVNNTYPLKNDSENEVFNYWWVAHLVDIRIDAYLRTKDEVYLVEAEKTYAYNKNRNNSTLIHEYYDDMLWNALAALRLYELTNKSEYLRDATEVCDDIIATGWNDTEDGGFAWKRTQMTYKNTPVNAPIIILALRLYRLNQNPIYLETSQKTLAWMKEKLINPETKFVEDGINRNEDGKVDIDWRFTYNQGVYIGALLEFYNISGEKTYLDDANQCASTSLEVLVENGVFNDQGDGGDIGLFKGILYRYLGILYLENKHESIKDFIVSSCTILVTNALYEDHLLAYRDWTLSSPAESVFLADQLSGVMALEVAALIE